MSDWLQARGGVFVVGIGVQPYAFPSDTPYTALGLGAARQALADAQQPWSRVDSAFVGTASLGMAAGKVMLRHLGASEAPVTQVENASASGSFAFRQACLEIASGASELALVVGVDKAGDSRKAADKDGLERLCGFAQAPVVTFALLAQRFLRERGETAATLARVAVKNHGNAAHNPYAQFRKARTLEQVLASPKVAGELTVQQCCPRGEGAAAVVLASAGALGRLGIDARRAVRVRGSFASGESSAHAFGDSIMQLVQTSAQGALRQAGLAPQELDLLELHDAFSIEELLYSEAVGVCEPGRAVDYLVSGQSAIGGRCAINASGGLLGMGHPIGPTGVGQIAELTRQLRGEAGPRQHRKPRHGMAHMIGLGSVAIAHVLAAPQPGGLP